MRGRRGQGVSLPVCAGAPCVHAGPLRRPHQAPHEPASWRELTAFSPQQYGLYSAFMGCFVYLLLGTSRDVTLGPTAIMSLLVSSYTFHEPAYAVLLAFLSGCIQLAMSFLGLGETRGLPAVGARALQFCCLLGARSPASWGCPALHIAFLALQRLPL